MVMTIPRLERLILSLPDRALVKLVEKSLSGLHHLKVRLVQPPKYVCLQSMVALYRQMLVPLSLIMSATPTVWHPVGTCKQA